MKFHSFACVWACEEAGACVNQTPLVRAPAPHRPGRSSTMTRYQDALLVLAGIRIMLSRLWQTLFSAPSEPVDWQESALLCLGLDGAGKSSLIRWAFDGTQADAGDAAPTAGFNVRTVVLPPDCKSELWELGGGPSIRPYWAKYATRPLDGVVFVVDAADSARLSEAAAALAEVLRSSVALRMLPILVLANKHDQPNALPCDAIAERLHLASLREGRLINGPLKVEAVSAIDGRNVKDALRWLATGGGADSTI